MPGRNQVNFNLLQMESRYFLPRTLALFLNLALSLPGVYAEPSRSTLRPMERQESAVGLEELGGHLTAGLEEWSRNAFQRSE